MPTTTASPSEPRQHDERAAGEELAAYLARVPRDLRAAAWKTWRAKNPPAYLCDVNRRGGRCGGCAGPLTQLTRLCVACHRRELEAAQ